MKETVKVGALPNREALINWGMVPCSFPQCRILVNGELLGDRCKKHQKTGGRR